MLETEISFGPSPPRCLLICGLEKVWSANRVHQHNGSCSKRQLEKPALDTGRFQHFPASVNPNEGIKDEALVQPKTFSGNL